MVVFSTLRQSLSGCRNLPAVLARGERNVLSKTQANKALVRWMGGGHEHKMVIKPTRYEYQLWKDHVHLYFAISLIPMAILITAVNTFVGRAELIDIPEGYEPKHWEYHQHPISRWMARYIYSTPQKEYEKTLHLINLENEKRRLRKLESRVRELMSTRGDYKGWYYVPVNERKVYVAREADKQRRDASGTN